MHSKLILSAAALVGVAQAVAPVTMKDGGFYTGNDPFFFVGVGYQPHGPVELNQGFDPFSNFEECQRDVYLLQQLGVNSVRTYAVNTTLNHDECMSLFNAAGIYVVLDVNAPGWRYSINREEPWTSYNHIYMENVFKVMEQFSAYPNVVAYFSGNELANEPENMNLTAPYMRAIQRDMRQYAKAHGLREIPIGYSTADVVEFRQDLGNYLACTADDEGHADYYGINSYAWCGDNEFETSAYKELTDLMEGVQMPMFFSEYGCNEVLPRKFGDAEAIYGPKMNHIFSGGIVYEYHQEANNYGLVDVNFKTGNAKLLPDFNTLRNVHAGLEIPTSNTYRKINRPKCSSVFGSIKSFDPVEAIPQVKDITALIKKGVTVEKGKIVSVDLDLEGHKWVVEDVEGNPIQGAKITKQDKYNPLPTAVAVTDGGNNSGDDKEDEKNAAPSLRTGGAILITLSLMVSGFFL